jgi:hypothetical protein
MIVGCVPAMQNNQITDSTSRIIHVDMDAFYLLKC